MKKDEWFYDYPQLNNLKEIVYNSVEKYAEINAFVLKEKNGEETSYKYITYKEFLNQVNNLGTGLFNLGMKGKRIAVISKNRYEWVWGYISTLLGDMIAVPLDKGLQEAEIESCLIRSKADAVIFEDSFSELMKNLKASGKTNLKEYICMDKSSEFKNIYDIAKEGEKILAKGNKDYINTEINSEDMRMILFTSGTTSMSKAVMLSHKNVATNVSSVVRVGKVNPGDSNLAFLPFHHTMGSTGLMFVFAQGACTAFPDGLRYVAQNLKEYKVAVFIGVPLLIESIYKKMMKEIQKQGKEKLINTARKVTNGLLKLKIDIRRKVFKQVIDQLGGELRFVINGAAAIDKEVAKGFNELGIRLIQGYGLTETSPILSVENDKYLKYGSSGFPVTNVQVKIADEDEFGVGEIIASGPSIMLGYYENEEATNDVLKNGWFYTGDLGYIDEEGYVFVTGRKKNVIVLKNGKNIYPEELEALVNKLEVVKDSMVYGAQKADDVMVSVKVQYDEEIVKEKYPNKTKEELVKIVWDQIKEINKTLPTYKYIKNMVLTGEEFIKTTTAKIKRYEEIKKMQTN